MEKIELRFLDSDLTVNEEEMIVEGLVNETGAWSHILGQRRKFKEKIEKGAFSKAIESSQRIDFLGEHRTDMLLATTENGSLELWEDEEGLKMRARIAPTSYGKDLFVLMKNRMINHMSFGFQVVKDNWKKLMDGTFERSVTDLVLKEVSVVRNPAYPQSAIAARGIELIEDVEIPADVDVEERAEENVDTQPSNEVVTVANPQPISHSLKVEFDTKQMSEMFAQLKNELLESLKPQNVEVPAAKIDATSISIDKISSGEITANKITAGTINADKLSANVLTNLPKATIAGSVVPEVKPETTQQEVKPEVIDNSKGVVDLLAKYKELQSFK